MLVGYCIIWSCIEHPSFSGVYSIFPQRNAKKPQCDTHTAAVQNVFLQMPSRIRFHDNFPMRHRRGEHDLGGGVSATLNLSDKRIQFLRGRKCHLDQHGVHTGNAVALQHIGAAVNERIKLRLLVCRQLQIDESGNMITQLLPVNYGIISQNDSLLFQHIDSGRNRRSRQKYHRSKQHQWCSGNFL